MDAIGDLVYDTPFGATHSPMISGVVGGVEARFILDSGATDHVWTTEFAESAGLSYNDTDPGADHVGVPVASWMIGDAALKIGGHGFALSDVVAIREPEVFAGWGLGGFLSPQKLKPNDWVIMDMVTNQFLVDDSPGIPRMQSFGLSDFIGIETETTREGLVVFPGRVLPFAETILMVNTGGKSTEFAASVVPELAHLGTVDVSGKGISGEDVHARLVTDQVLEIGECRLAVERLWVRDEIPGPSGMIGMDLMEGSLLVLSATTGMLFVPKARLAV